MKTLTHSFSVRQQQGFKVYVLNNEEVELAVVPELGAKIISLKNLRTGREWMWHPADGLKLFWNRPGDDFSRSPLVGADECLPTITPCSWQGRDLPDHGEVWSAPWKVDSAAWENGILKTSVRLKISPFEFKRTIELVENEIRVGYQLNNLSARDEAFVWAIHPLLRLQAGDQLELPTATRTLLNGATWVDAVETVIPEKKSAKIFAAPVSEGLAAISNQTTGDRLEFAWNSAENNTLGLWLTRGGWHGHHHFALEPTNADTDVLTLAAGQNRCGVVAASNFVTWQLSLRVGA
ncbi:MAG: hypothetical protein QOD03_668 [Verrucomicrobiota bacterium]